MRFFDFVNHFWIEMEEEGIPEEEQVLWLKHAFKDWKSRREQEERLGRWPIFLKEFENDNRI